MLKPFKLFSLALPLLITLAVGQKTQAETTPTPATPAPVTTSMGKSCDELKAEIETKLKTKGVKAFTLEIVAKADVKEGKVVGSCERGSKKLVYKRG